LSEGSVEAKVLRGEKLLGGRFFILKLKSKQTNGYIIIAAYHGRTLQDTNCKELGDLIPKKWNAEDAQGYYFETVYNFVHKLAIKYGCPAIIGGDFNFSPSDDKYHRPKHYKIEPITWIIPVNHSSLDRSWVDYTFLDIVRAIYIPGGDLPGRKIPGLHPTAIKSTYDFLEYEGKLNEEMKFNEKKR
jgi:hypothetical protein